MAGVETGLRQNRLKQLNGVSRRILDEDLSPADAGHDIVAEAGTRLSQSRDPHGEIIDLGRRPVGRFGQVRTSLNAYVGSPIPVRPNPRTNEPAAGSDRNLQVDTAPTR